ncbi:kelch repeat-containing protein At3g27220-like isoform X2 [Miscanthus floridulus]|uniref:kelch repeat-containing protein At3g27220-like isoform X2 n=1 Tax=Miscanthus floridulus TaxID=154761 RepID=UPI003457999C
MVTSKPLPLRLAVPLALALLLALALVANFLWASSSRRASPLSASSSRTVMRKRAKAVGHLNATYADLPAPHWDWEEMPAAPVPRLDGASVQIGDLLYVFSGYGNIDHVHSHVDVYNFTSNTWAERFDMPKEMAHSHLGMASDGRYIYAVSGQYGPQCRASINRNFVFDTETREWHELPPLPFPRYAPATQLWRGRLHVMGGGKEDRHEPGLEHWSLAVKDGKALENEWQAEVPIPRGGPHRFLRTGHPLGLAPKKSLAIQAGQMTSPGVTPVSSRSGADVGSALANPTASVVAPTPAKVTEQAASSMVDVVQPAEGRIPPVEVVVTAPSQDQPGAAAVALEGVVQSAPPGAQVDPPVALEAAQMEEGPVGGSSSAAVVPHRVRREPPPAPLSGGSRSPAWGEPPLQWMAAQDPTSALFSLDDHSESMEREGLDIGISTMLEALDQARGALREIVVPTT